MLDNLEKDLLEKVAGIKDKPQGAYNIRLNSKAVDRAFFLYRLAKLYA